MVQCEGGERMTDVLTSKLCKLVDNATDGFALRQLQHDDDIVMAAQQPGRDGVQRLRTLLQTARRQPPARYEEGCHSGSHLIYIIRHSGAQLLTRSSTEMSQHNLSALELG